MSKRVRRKCRRCGKQASILKEVDTPAGRRELCVVCRTDMLPFATQGDKVPRAQPLKSWNAKEPELLAHRDPAVVRVMSRQ